MPDTGVGGDLGFRLPAAQGDDVRCRDHRVFFADEDQQAAGEGQAAGRLRSRCGDVGTRKPTGVHCDAGAEIELRRSEHCDVTAERHPDGDR